MKGEGIRRRILVATLLLLPFFLQGCKNSSSVGMNPFVTEDSAEKFSLNKQEIQKAYDLSLSKDYLAVIGSQLPRSMILNSYWRFLEKISSGTQPETQQGSFSALGYFAAPSLTVIKKICTPDSPYIGAVMVRLQSVELATPPCGPGSGAIRIPLGYSMRGFIVPSTNRFATAIPLDVLAEASKSGRPLSWSDINPQWPKRQIRWVFNAQTDFKADLKIMGIRPPDQYLLAANYNRSFVNVANNPDNLLFSPTTPSLKARLKGAQFRIVPIQAERNSPPIAPGADALNRYPAKLVRTIYLYINSRSPNRCVIGDFADFMLNNNARLMNESNVIPLRPEERIQALLALQGHRHDTLKDDTKSLCRGYQDSTHKRDPNITPIRR